MMIKRTTLATLTVASILSACGGGSGGDAGGGTTDSPVPASGVFIDSAVAGIHYATATQSGETDAEGQFKYLPGETVVFSIGDIQLPAVAASDAVTPLMVFETNDFTDQRVVNLGRLLQSLDDDGDLDNGIQITAEARTAATGLTLDFATSLATFEANTDVINLLASGGGSVTLVSAEDAIAHLQEQAAQNDLSLVGSWYLAADDVLITVTFFPDGKYMLAQDAPADEVGEAGVEYGSYSWDPVSGALTTETTTDTNGEWGLSHPLGEYAATRTGDTLTFTETQGTEVIDEVSVQRVVSTTDNAIVGTWLVDQEGDVSVFVFMADGHFTLAETGTPNDDGQPGIEHGTYTWNAETGAITVDEMLTNTNGEWGISHDAPLTVAVEGNAMTMTFAEEAITLTRVK